MFNFYQLKKSAENETGDAYNSLTDRLEDVEAVSSRLVGLFHYQSSHSKPLRNRMIFGRVVPQVPVALFML